MPPSESYPICRVRGCGEEFPLGRAELGYTTCLAHAKMDPQNPPSSLVLQDVNKSNPTITRSPEGFVSAEYASRPVRVELRQTRAYIRLNTVDKERSHL